MVTVITAVPGNVPRVVEDDDQRVAALLVCYIGGRLILKILLAKQADDLGFLTDLGVNLILEPLL